MTGRTARHLRGQRGYSLIELLVAVGIFGLLAALGLPHLDTRRQDIQTATTQVIADYRWARNRAITSGVHFGIEWTSTNSYEVQRMKQAANGTWSKDVTVKSVTLPSLHQHHLVLAVGSGVQHPRHDGDHDVPALPDVLGLQLLRLAHALAVALGADL